MAIDQFFDGEAMPLFQHLIESRGLSDAEIDQLQQSLDDLKAKQRKSGAKKFSRKEPTK